MLKEEFDPDEGFWFDNHQWYFDLGFLGVEKDYDVNIGIPFKKKKNQNLTDDQKAYNKQVSKNRIVVEHAIGGMKRYRVLSDRLRIKNYNRYNQISGICAGLWNYLLVA